MLSPLKALLCRHDFYWSERHGSERCRRCGKKQPAEARDVRTGESVDGPAPAQAATPATPEAFAGLIPAEQPAVEGGADPVRPLARSPSLMSPRSKAFKAEAEKRRAALPTFLAGLIEGARPTREEAIDAVLAVIEDAHSADPLLFGADAAGHFARLLEARSAPRC